MVDENVLTFQITGTYGNEYLWNHKLEPVQRPIKSNEGLRLFYLNIPKVFGAVERSIFGWCLLDILCLPSYSSCTFWLIFSDSDCHFRVFIGWRWDVNIWRGGSWRRSAKFNVAAWSRYEKLLSLDRTRFLWMTEDPWSPLANKNEQTLRSTNQNLKLK